MNAESKTCPQCGAAIPTGAPEGMCPKCLLAGASIQTETGPVSAAKTQRVPPTIAEVAAAFPQLEIVDLIGRGGMGFVFRARQPKLERDVALKILPQHLAEDPKFAERFAREGKLLAKLNHPNIVSIFDFGESGGFFFLLMEFVDGVNLRQAMQASRFTADQALLIVPKICEALQFAHEEGVLHRDIKPENILLDAKGRIKIADFGIAKMMENGGATLLSPGESLSNEQSATGLSPFRSDPSVTPGSNLTAAGSALGTPQYMAPEQIDQPATVDHRADIYSLGVVFYELLTGELPMGSFAPPSSRTPVGAEVDEVVARALERERERRQQSAGELKTQVETAARAVSNPSDPIKARGPSIKALERRDVWALGLAMFYTGLVGGIPLIGALPVGESAVVFLVAALVFGVTLFLNLGLRVWAPLTTREQSERVGSWMRAFAFIGAIMCLPVCGFGFLFLFQLFAELSASKSGWNPNRAEALLVPLAILGAFVLPWSSWQLRQVTRGVHRQSGTPPRQLSNPWPRRIFILIIAMISLPLGLLIISVAVPMLAWQKLEPPEDGAAVPKVVESQDWWIGRYRLVEMLDDGRSLTDEELESISAPREMMSWLSPEGWRFERNRNPWTLFESIESQDFNRVLVNLTERKGQLEIVRDGTDRLRVRVLGIPDLVTVLERTSEPQFDSVNHAIVTSSNTFRAMIGSGFVELLAITHPPHENRWWRPDGTSVEALNFKLAGSRALPQTDDRIHEFVFRLVDPPNGSSAMVFRASNYKNRASEGVTHVDGHYLSGYQWFSIEAPEDIRTVDVQIGVAIDQWETVATRNGTGGVTSPIIWKNKEYNLSWTETTRGADRGIVQSYSHNFDTEENQFRVVAILNNGDETPGMAGRMGDIFTAHFYDLELEDVKGFRLETRPYQWVVFPDVHLPERTISNRDALFELQLKAVNYIESLELRDEALSMIALSAVKVENMPHIRRALDAMTGTAERDDAAVAVARALYALEKKEDAISIANSIADLTKRNAILKELVK